MKFIAIILLTLFSVSAFSMPNVGDSVVLSYSDVDTKEAGTLQETIIKYSPSIHAFKEKIVISDNDGVTTTYRWTEANAFPSKKAMEATLESCEDNDGKPEKLKTPAGEFDTCAIERETEVSKGKVWYGMVPFGNLKTESLSKKTGKHVIYLLESFKFGKK